MIRNLMILLVFFVSSQSGASEKSGFGSLDFTTLASEAIILTDLKIESRIRGGLNETTLDFALKNGAKEDSSVSFQFLTPERALIREFAIKTDGNWKPTVLKEEETTQPLLSELRKNPPGISINYSGRIDIPQMSTKEKTWLRIRYVQEMKTDASGFSFNLPIAKNRYFDSLVIVVDYLGEQMESGKVNEAYRKRGAFSTQERRFVYRFEEEKTKAPDEFKFTIQSKASRDKQAVVEHASDSKTLENYAFHGFRDFSKGNRKLSKNMLVFVDTSRSARESLNKNQVDALQKLLAMVPKSVKQKRFAFDFEVRPLGNIDVLLSNMDGSTNLDGVFNKIEKLQGNSKAPVDVLIVSDAYATLQTQTALLEKKFEYLRLYFLPTSAHFNEDFAQQMARNNGGLVLPTLSKDSVAKVWSQFTRRMWEFSEFKCDGFTVLPEEPKLGSLVANENGAHVYFQLETSHKNNSCVARYSDGGETIEMEAQLKTAWAYDTTNVLFKMNRQARFFAYGDERREEMMGRAKAGSFLVPGTCMTNKTRCNRESFALIGDDSETEEVKGSFHLAPPELSKAQQRKEDLNAGVQLAVDAKDIRQKYYHGPDSAKEILRAYLNMNKEPQTDPWFFVEFAELFERKEDLWMAQRVRSNLFEVMDDGRSLRTMGLLGCVREKCSWSILAFEKLIRMYPDTPQNYRDLAWLYFEQGNYAKAIETMSELKGKEIPEQFPGMQKIIERESLWMEKFDIQVKKHDLSKHWPMTYSWVTWDHPNVDVDFWIKENENSLVSFSRTNGIGELINDFTVGEGPEVYSLNKRQPHPPDFFASYRASDEKGEREGVIVRWVQVIRYSETELKFKSATIPLSIPGKKIRLN